MSDGVKTESSLLLRSSSCLESVSPVPNVSQQGLLTSSRVCACIDLTLLVHGVMVPGSFMLTPDFLHLDLSLFARGFAQSDSATLISDCFHIENLMSPQSFGRLRLSPIVSSSSHFESMLILQSFA